MWNTPELRMKFESQMLERFGILYLLSPGEVFSIDCDLLGPPPSQVYRQQASIPDPSVEIRESTRLDALRKFPADRVSECAFVTHMDKEPAVLRDSDDLVYGGFPVANVLKEF